MSEWSNSSAVVNTVISVIALVVSVVSVFLVYIQIKQTNKLNLFKRRLDIWTIVEGLMELCKENKTSFSKKYNETEFGYDLNFTLMTNNSSLYSAGNIIHNPSEQTYRIEFLKKMEELKNVASEIEFLFKDDIASLMSGFVNDYHDYLFTSYKYQLCLQDMKNTHKEAMFRNESLEKVASRVKEPTRRKELYASIDKLLASFNKINSDKVKQEIKNQVRVDKNTLLRKARRRICLYLRHNNLLSVRTKRRNCDNCTVRSYDERP